MRLTIVRHGETEENVNGIAQGWLPGKLTSRGMAQIDALGRSLSSEKIDVIFSSDLSRTKKTAEAILNYVHAPVHYVSELRERNHGIFQGRPRAEYYSAVSESGTPWTKYRPEGGESIEDVYGRASRFVDHVYETHPDKRVLIVTHGGVARCLYSFYTKIPLEDAMHFRTINAGSVTLDVQEHGTEVIKESIFVRQPAA